MAASSVRLAHRDLGGEGEPLVVLHGLLGSARNWSTVGALLATHFRVFVLDLRNHGRSPHARGMSFRQLGDDVWSWIEHMGLGECHVMGHSLGGKVAMRMACDRPESVRRLYVLDIAPRPYPPEGSILRAMADLPVQSLGSRTEAQQELAAEIPDLPTRLFVLTNLVRAGGSGFAWQIGLDELLEGQEEMRASPLSDGEHFDSPTLFVVGGRSPYVVAEDHELVRRHFPKAEIVVLDELGHNVHTEGGEDFVRQIVDFDRSHRADVQ